MMSSKARNMTIRYVNGSTFEAVLLSRTDRNMRVALCGADDIVELEDVNGTWVTDDCEPVQVIFAWQRTAPVEEPSESDCICAPEVAARLIHLLHAGESEEETATAVSLVAEAASAAARLV
jgi:hypothetical protein